MQSFILTGCVALSKKESGIFFCQYQKTGEITLPIYPWRITTCPMMLLTKPN